MEIKKKEKKERKNEERKKEREKEGRKENITVIIIMCRRLKEIN